MIYVREMQDIGLVKWAQEKLSKDLNQKIFFDANDCHVMAVDDGKDLLAVILFYNMVLPAKIEMAIVSNSPKWCTRNVLYQMANFCFNVCKVKRIYTQVCASNSKALAMNRRLGLRETAVLPESIVKLDGTMEDNHIFTMTESECKWVHRAKAQV